MREAGLIYYWMKSTRPNVGRCLEEAKEKYSSSPKTFSPLSLKNLEGAFVILAIGYVAAFFVFIGEKMMFRYPFRSIPEGLQGIIARTPSLKSFIQNAPRRTLCCHLADGN